MANQAKTKQPQNLSFFKKIYYSITKFEKYAEMSAEGTASAFKYLSILMLIFSIIVSSGLAIELYNTINSGINYIQNEISEIKITDGKLSIDSIGPIKIYSQIHAIDQIIIDTQTESEDKINEYINSIPADNTGIVVLKDKAIVKANETNQKVEYDYKEILSKLNLNKDTITKQDIINYFTGSGAITIYTMFFIFMTVYVFVLYLISVLVDTLLIAVLGNITVLFTKLKLKFSAVYNMGVYALTLSILLNAIYLAINAVTGFELKYFQIMYTSIAYVCLVAAIFMIRLDFEKKQAELIRIMEEQKKVKQEMQEKKQEREKEQNQTPDKEEKKNDEEDNQKKKTHGEEPTGSEA